MPERIQQKRTKGWRKPENTVSVARPHKYGNPLKRGDLWIGVPLRTNSELVAAYRWLWENNPAYAAEARAELRGKNLMCFCPLDQPCHADVLLELANGKE
jgi:hypothetical protein